MDNPQHNWTKDSAVTYLRENYEKIGSPIAFGNRNTIYKFFNKVLTLKEIQDHLNSVEVYSLHKEARKRAKYYVPMFSKGARDLVEADLVDVSYFDPHQNNNTRYLLVVIDTFTKAIFLEGIENKQTDTVLTAFIKIHRRMTDKNQRIKVICTDLGGDHFSNNITHLFFDSLLVFVVVFQLSSSIGNSKNIFQVGILN